MILGCSTVRIGEGVEVGVDVRGGEMILDSGPLGLDVLGLQVVPL